jgi:hypothetical protein
MALLSISWNLLLNITNILKEDEEDDNTRPLLVMDHIDDTCYATTEQDEGIILALQHCNRVRRLRLHMPLQNLKGLIIAIDNEFPMLEWLRMRTR